MGLVALRLSPLRARPRTWAAICGVGCGAVHGGRQVAPRCRTGSLRKVVNLRLQIGHASVPAPDNPYGSRWRTWRSRRFMPSACPSQCDCRASTCAGATGRRLANLLVLVETAERRNGGAVVPDGAWPAISEPVSEPEQVLVPHVSCHSILSEVRCVSAGLVPRSDWCVACGTGWLKHPQNPLGTM